MPVNRRKKYKIAKTRYGRIANIDVGAGYTRELKKEGNYLACRIKIPVGKGDEWEVFFNLLPNKYKNKKNHPDYIIYVKAREGDAFWKRYIQDEMTE